MDDCDNTIDVHAHLWPPELIDALRARTAAPRLSGWTLITATEAPFEVNPRHHDPLLRAAAESGRSRVLLSLSCPLGIEDLAPDQAAPLLAAWHRGLSALPSVFWGWAAIGRLEPGLDELGSLLATPGIAGLQIPATWLTDPAGVESCLPALQLCRDADRPVLVHPGPAGEHRDRPDWWAAVADYPTQLQRAWWTWWHAGRSQVPGLRICFAAGAGLAPAHHERYAARSGRRFVVDPDIYVETSSYGRQGVDALVRALGIDTVVLGSDRPYAEPLDPRLGEAAWHAIARVNPRRLLGSADRQSTPRPASIPSTT